MKNFPTIQRVRHRIGLCVNVFFLLFWGSKCWSNESNPLLEKNLMISEKDQDRLPKDKTVPHKIEPIQSIQQTVHVLNNLDNQTLVLFDIDGVISIPREPCLHPRVFDQYGSMIKNLTSHLTHEERHIFNHLVVARASQLIETTFVDILIDLQSRNIPTFGFTASSPGVIHSHLPPFYQVREKYLKELNIDFSVQHHPNIDFLELSPTKGEYPCVRNGIIYSCGLHNTKGAVLQRFLSDHPNVSKIIFFDDKLKNLNSVMETLTTDFPKIEFLGFHYQGANQLLCEDPGPDSVREYIQSLITLLHAE